MPTFTDKIASWEEIDSPAGTLSASNNSIATEAQQEESAEWGVCIDALLKIWSDASPLGDPKPNRSAIEAAIAWVAFLRKRCPSAPPTCIIPEPDGGIIVERRVDSLNGHEYLCELTFYNNGRAERTDYCDGRVRQLASIPRRPQGESA